MLPSRSPRLTCAPFWIPLLGLTGATVTTGAAGQSPSPAVAPMPITRIHTPIRLDGLSHEAAWADVPPLPMTVFAPVFGAAPSERTEIRVAYDDTHLYVAGRLYDSEPDLIRANTLYRDQYSGGDVFAVILDTYDDHESALWFAVNPAGVRTDRTVSNDAEFGAGFPMNGDWNTFWDVATTQTAEGWFAEMRIPFSSLGFQDTRGRVRMGMIAYRFIARKNERHLFPAIPPNWDLSFAKPSQARRIVLDGVYRRRPVYLTPYVLGGVAGEPLLNNTATAYATDTDLTREVGIDLKYNPSSNLTLDLTVNTDFAQVEVDDQQVNLTRFSLFFPEKRQFFQERATTFEFNTGGVTRLFHSRQIGLEDGRPVRILGGARVVGRVGDTDVGILSVQTEATSTRASENASVVRVRRQVFNSTSNVGAMATGRLDTEGTRQLAWGIDADIRLFGREFVTVKWAATNDNTIPTSPGLASASRVFARWERRQQRGLNYSASYLYSGAHYRPALGFIRREDFTAVAADAQYQWFLSAASAVRTLTVGAAGRAFIRNPTDDAQSALIEPSVEFEFKSGMEVTVTGRAVYESVLEPFSLAGDAAQVPAGDYWFREGQLRVNAPRSGRWRGSATVVAGSFFDGWRVSAEVSPLRSLSRHVELGGSYRVDRLRFPERGAEATSHLVGIRGQLAMNTHLFFSAFLQYSNTADAASANTRLRYHIREGQDLWLVYTEGWNTTRPLVPSPRLPLSRGRTLMLKYNHTFIP